MAVETIAGPGLEVVSVHDMILGAGNTCDNSVFFGIDQRLRKVNQSS